MVVPVRRADSRHAGLRHANGGRRREGRHLLRAVSVVAIHAGGVAIVVEQRVFGRIVRIGPAGKRMADLGELGEDVRRWREKGSCRRCGRRCSPARSARAASAPAPAHCAACGTRCTRSPPPCHSSRGSPPLATLFVARAWALVLQPASGFTWFDNRARGIVAGQAHLRVGAVAHQEVLRQHIDGLHVRIVARRALDVALDQLAPRRSDRRSCPAMPATQSGRSCP